MPLTEILQKACKILLYEVDDNSIKVADAFQRGDDETGVWPAWMKRDFVDSFKKGYPFGMITLVKPAGNPLQPWSILDGANRIRCLRDFKKNKFKSNKGKYFRDWNANEIAAFNERRLTVEQTKIQREDPKNIISDMFCRLNTRVMPLSNGELIKAMGWQRDIHVIELSKVWARWDDYGWDEEDKEYDTLQFRWEELFGVIKPHKRCINLAFFTGLYLSSIYDNIELFNKSFQIQDPYLSKEVDIDDDTEKVVKFHMHIEQFLNVMTEINDRTLFKCQKGVPALSSVSIIWDMVLRDMFDDVDFEEKLIAFYQRLLVDSDLCDKFESIMKKGGDNHVTNSKLANAVEFINNWAPV